jgi:probable HAF family extracellular repeat protein
MTLIYKTQLSLLVTGLLSVIPATQAGSPAYTITPILVSNYAAIALNNKADTAGRYTIGKESTGAAFLPAGAKSKTILGALPGPIVQDTVSAMNDSRLIVGISNNHGVKWPYGWVKPVDLGSGTAPSGVNAIGQIVGSDKNGNAALWPVRSIRPIALKNPLSNNGAVAYAINDCSEIVGVAIHGIDYDHAVLWEAGSHAPVDLGGLNAVYTSTSAAAINNKGEIVGSANNSGNGPLSYRAVMWPAGANKAIDLGVLAGDTDSFAEGVNNHGQIVGVSYDANYNAHAVLWKPGSTSPIELNTLIPQTGINLETAVAINDKGQILASDASGYVLLTPTSKPTAVVSGCLHRH